ncbi:MAG: hypothetical protein JNM50_01300 [Chromatiales bacterium]|nr:hypothetical protein [Chromatiales bacterium]
MARMTGMARLGSLALLAGLTACGDGGSFAPNDSSTPLGLTAANALAVTGEIDLAHFSAGDVTGGLTSELQAGVIADLVSSGAGGAVPAFTVGCDFAGTATLSGTISGGSTYFAGDRIVATFTGCQIAPASPALTGAADITVVSFAGSLATSNFTLVVDVVADGLAVASAAVGRTSTGDGPFRLSFTSEYNGAVPVRLTQVARSPALDLAIGNASFKWRSLVAQAVLQFAAGIPSQSTLAAAGDIDSERLNGSVAVATPVTLVAPADNDPATSFASGQRTMGGSGSSSIRLQPQNATEVRLSVDSTGDGVVDDVIDTTWTAIRASSP